MTDIPRQPIPRSAAWKALDSIEDALSTTEGTMALFSAMVDHDIESDPVCVGAIERHLAADLAALRAAFRKAHADIFDGGAK